MLWLFDSKLIFRNDAQVGHSEDWLCSIFSNLTEDLYVALRAAWLSGMIVHKHHMLQAGQSKFSSMRAFVRQHALGSKVPRRSTRARCACSFAAHPDNGSSESKHLLIRTVYRGKDPAAIAQDPAEEELWLYELGRMGGFELCAYDRASVAVTRSRPPPDVYLAWLVQPTLILHLNRPHKHSTAVKAFRRESYPTVLDFDLNRPHKLSTARVSCDAAAQAHHRPGHRPRDGALRQRRLLPTRRRRDRRGAPRAGGGPRPAGARDPRRPPLQVKPLSPLLPPHPCCTLGYVSASN